MAKHIFFHVGISKTGSTFLQQRVFPYVKNIQYIPTHKYRQCTRNSSDIPQSDPGVMS